MLEIVYRHLPVVLVFLTNALYSWVWGGTRDEPLLEWMPWFSLLALQVLFFYPQRNPWEDVVSARQRTWTGLAHDPLTWICMALTALLLLPLFNKGLCPVCDAKAILDGADPRPPMRYLPWCVNVAEHASSLMWIVPTLIASLAVRHALVKHGRRVFMEMLIWNGALLAVYGFIMRGMDALGPYGDAGQKVNGVFFSTFGYANMAGSYFVLLCAISVGIWRQRNLEMGAEVDAAVKNQTKPRNVWLKANYPVVAAVMNFFGALCSLSRAAIIAAFVIMLMSFIYIFAGIFASKRRERIRSVKGAAWAALGMMIFIALIYIFAPTGMSREIKSVSSREVLDRVSGKGVYHTRVSTAIFKDYPVFGVGFWGYGHLCTEYMTPQELKNIQQNGGANVHNDYLQFLCEFGVVGTGLIFAVFVFLILPVVRDWYRFHRVSKFTRPEEASTANLAVYSLPPPIFWTFVGAILVAIHAFGDCPLRSGAVMSALLTALASTEGFLPHRDISGKILHLESHRDEHHRHHHHHHHHHHYEEG